MRTPRPGEAPRRFVRYEGLFFDEFAPDSAWIREEGRLHLPPLDRARELVLRGEFKPDPAARPVERSAPRLRIFLDGSPAGRVVPAGPGPWEVRVPFPAAPSGRGSVVRLRLEGVGWTNFLAWLGRITGFGSLQHFRRQRKNRQLRVAAVELGDGARIFDFSRRQAPFAPEFARGRARLGLNVVGFLAADLGIGESARAMVRAADAAGLPVALVPLKLNCLNRLGDTTYAGRFQEDNPHGVNVVHVDPPGAGDLDHHHGRAFRAGKYNVGYFAWELPDFPDAWLRYCDYFDEIWTPSDFSREAIALKCPQPVLTMPHAISFSRPSDPPAALRARFGLPEDAFLFLSLFDFNSYAERKNPLGAVEAFRRSGLAGAGAALVLKVHNAEDHAADFAALQSAVRDLPGTVFLSGTLARQEIYALQAACDCFVSLHRSEGFGLAIAECMFLGKPVISTDWSAPAEFLTAANGCPVRARVVALDRSHGPYAKGSTWAEPDLEDASAWMRRVFGDRGWGLRLGEAAQATIESRFAPAAVGARYRRRLEAIAAF